MKTGAWRKIKGQMVYRNPWIKVVEDQVIGPDGKKSLYAIVIPKPGVAIVALDRKQKIYLVGQTRYPIKAYTWEVPNGGRNLKEQSLAAAKRELLEEVGLKARKWVFLGKVYPYPGVIKEIDSYFLATQTTSHQARPDGSEDITVRKFSLLDIESMIFEGQILDAMTIAAIFKYKLYLAQIKK